MTGDSFAEKIDDGIVTFGENHIKRIGDSNVECLVCQTLVYTSSTNKSMVNTLIGRHVKSVPHRDKVRDAGLVQIMNSDRRSLPGSPRSLSSLNSISSSTSSHKNIRQNVGPPVRYREGFPVGSECEGIAIGNSIRGQSSKGSVSSNSDSSQNPKTSTQTKGQSVGGISMSSSVVLTPSGKISITRTTPPFRPTPTGNTQVNSEPKRIPGPLSRRPVSDTTTSGRNGDATISGSKDFRPESAPFHDSDNEVTILSSTRLKPIERSNPTKPVTVSEFRLSNKPLKSSSAISANHSNSATKNGTELPKMTLIHDGNELREKLSSTTIQNGMIIQNKTMSNFAKMKLAQSKARLFSKILHDQTRTMATTTAPRHRVSDPSFVPKTKPVIRRRKKKSGPKPKPKSTVPVEEDDDTETAEESIKPEEKKKTVTLRRKAAESSVSQTINRVVGQRTKKPKVFDDGSEFNSLKKQLEITKTKQTSPQKPSTSPSDQSLDLEIKQLTLKKLRAEVENQELLRKATEERIKYYKQNHQDFGSLITAVHVLIDTLGRVLTNGDE